MAVSIYRGIQLQSTSDSTEVWQARIKKHVITGSLAAVKKSIDWWCDTASLIDPKEFESLQPKKDDSAHAGAQENFNGYTIKNDTGAANAWYCFFNGRLIKGSKLAIQKHIEAYLIAKKRAEGK
ncbi:DUF3319 domain-containing protein [Vibrio zhugei]|uniref:DUF3319 domain-containing protein n=1 Tax=Vibrio zhugei TaxID=2479546 RepID=A0ABV7CCG5_9VIBR|nr:DUF3319 domain-containing protein [Vibrio zhugei]